MLRYACGYTLTKDGVDSGALQHYLRQKSLQYTVRYTEFATGRVRDFWKDQASRLAKAWGGVMSRTIILRAKGTLSAWLMLVSLFCVSNTVAPQEATTGFDEFRISCASCHGVEGNGKLASILTVKPTDLTTLAKNNDGEFPVIRVYKMIDGREGFYAHGDRTMPVWGIRYLLEHAVRYGGNGGEQVVQARIMKLVGYIRSIQE
jgi:mono/diheme cytochrome c family protein